MKLGLLIACIFFASLAAAQSPEEQVLNAVAFDQRVNASIPLNTEFRNESGQPIHLSDYFGNRPVILVMGYYECPMLCSLVHQELLESLNQIDLKPGEDFELISVSIDPSETAETARLQRNTYAKRYVRGDATKGFHFLVGSEEHILRVANSIGFRYAYDEASGQYAHASGFVIATPSGTIHRYFFGVDFPPGEIKAALMTAALEKRGTSVKEVLLRCFHYDPVTGRFGPAIMNALRAGSLLTLAGLAYIIFKRSRREETKHEEATD